MTQVVIHHNTRCSKSREVLNMIRNAGLDPVVIDYLKTGWTRPQLLALFAVAGLTPREALRDAQWPSEELGALAATVSDEAVLEAMVADPALVNRPIVCTPRGVRLCRPVERVLDLLET